MHLDKHGYPVVLRAHQDFGLDFDDAYQFALAQTRGLTFVTQDGDFKRVKAEIAVRFL